MIKTRVTPSVCGVIAILILLCGLFSSVSQAATITVNSTTDVDGNDSNCTLREAITSINTGGVASTGCSVSGSGFGSDDTVSFDANLGGQTIELTQNSGIEITKSVKIDGSSLTGSVTIDGMQQNAASNHEPRIFTILGSVTVELDNLHLTNGRAARQGGAIFAPNNATVNIVNSTASGSSAGFGGFINILGTLTLTNSIISGNSAGDTGGGIACVGTLTLINSTVSSNSAGKDGGGIATQRAQTTLINSTVSDNSAGKDGGGIGSLGGNTFTLINSTMSGNSATNRGGGAFVIRGDTLNLANSIIANSGGGGDCFVYGTVNANKFNIIEDGSCDVGSGFNNAKTGDPKLGPLANNGGPTQTHALLEDSPAIGAGEYAICYGADVKGLDQRGTARPGCDIGAYEASIDNSSFYVIPMLNGKAVIINL